MLNIKIIQMKPFYGSGIVNYVDSYISSAKKLSKKHKFSPNIYSIGFTPFNLRDDERFNNDDEFYYSEIDEQETTIVDNGFDSEPNISESSDDDDFIPIE